MHVKESLSYEIANWDLSYPIQTQDNFNQMSKESNWAARDLTAQSYEFWTHL